MGRDGSLTGAGRNKLRTGREGRVVMIARVRMRPRLRENFADVGKMLAD